MQYADQLRAQYVVVLGDQELETKYIELKNMKTGEKLKAPLNSLARIIHIQEKSAQFIKDWDELAKPFESQEEIDFFKAKLSSELNLTKKISTDLQQALEGIKTYIKE